VPVATTLRPPRVPIRRDGGTWVIQSTLERRGLGPVVGVDEAGRGACAGPLVVASCVLKANDAAKFEELTDSKLLTPAARDRMYDLVKARAVDYSVVVISPDEVDSRGVHFANVEGMRRSVARLKVNPGYVLTDGFRITGFTSPSLAVIKGDLAVACIAAASVLAKVTRDRIMSELHDELPVYGFDEHKGYITGRHHAALGEHGPSAVHRWSYSNVASAGIKHGLRPPRRVALSVAAADVVHNGGSPRQGVESGRGGARVG
jgi:ribonuclease HII